MCSLIEWCVANWPGLLKDLIVMTVGVMLGYWLSVRWNLAQIEISRKSERKSLIRSISLLVADCVITMRDGRADLTKSMPPKRYLPTAGIEYFQAQLMRYEETKLLAMVSGLRYVLEQANQLVPAMVQEFTALSTDSDARGELKRGQTLNINIDESWRMAEKGAC